VIQHVREQTPWKVEAMTARQGRRIVHRFWQAGGGYDRNLFTEETIRKAVEYTEWNPVRRNLVSNPCEWVWSSARARAGSCDVPLRIDPIEVALDRRERDQGKP
jgi:putative transposase